MFSSFAFILRKMEVWVVCSLKGSKMMFLLSNWMVGGISGGGTIRARACFCGS